jgi:hypothetical protein
MRKILNVTSTDSCRATSYVLSLVSFVNLSLAAPKHPIPGGKVNKRTRYTLLLIIRAMLSEKSKGKNDTVDIIRA